MSKGGVFCDGFRVSEKRQNNENEKLIFFFFFFFARIYPQYLVFLNNNTLRKLSNQKPSPRPELDRLLQSDENLLRRLESELKLNVGDDDDDTSTDSSVSFSGVRRAMFSGMAEDEEELSLEQGDPVVVPKLNLSEVESPVKEVEVPPVATTTVDLANAPETPVKAVPQVELVSRGSAAHLETPSRLSRSSMKAPPPSFKAVMGDKILFTPFRAYCESVHKTEFLEFLEQANLFKNESANGKFSRGFTIWSEFLATSSTTPVMQKSKALDTIKSRIQVEAVDASLFDEAEAHVLDHLENVIFPEYNRFLQRHNEATIKSAAIKVKWLPLL